MRVTPLILLCACDLAPAQVVSVSEPLDTRDQVGPYVVQAEVRGGLGGDDVLLCWQVDGGETRSTTMRARDARSDLFAGELPGQPAGSTISFVVRIHDGVACPAPRETDTLHGFRILPSSLACRADSDCLLGREVCDGDTCRAFDGTCAAEGACPGGTSCDATRDPPLCVIPARVCGTDLDCPVAELCDAERGSCVARPACATDLPCPDGLTCDLTLGWCARPA